MYYLSDRTNAVVHIVNLAFFTKTGQITSFRGVTIINGTVNKPMLGPNSLLYILGHNKLYIKDKNNSVKIIDLSSNTIVDTIPLGIFKHTDEITYNMNNKLTIVIGPDNNIVILVFIFVTDRKVIYKVSFDNITNGIEQSA